MSATTKRESLQDLLDSLPNLVEHFYNDTLTPHAATRSAMSPVPAEFTNWRDEQHAWRETAVLFDQSHHMPELFLKGPDAFKLLNYVGINSFDKFVPGRAKQYLGCGPDGKVIGECVLHYLEENSFELISGMPLLNWVQFQAETGGYDVTVERDNNTALNPTGRRTNFRYGMDGPNAEKIFTEVIDGAVPDIPFFRTARVRIAGIDVLALRHGMAGHKGVELSGPYEHGDKVRAAILEVGKKYGLKQGGTKAYFSTATESGWMPYPVPAIYTSSELRPYREWLPRTSWEANTQIGGSYLSRNIEEYYVTPWELGVGRLVKFDHEFIGRAALERFANQPVRTRVTLVWNKEDVAQIQGSLLQPGIPYKYMDLPVCYYSLQQHDEVKSRDGTLVGISAFCGYSGNEAEILSLARLDPEYAVPGTELLVTWGEPSGGSRKPNVERHRQFKVRAIVGPAPYAASVRRMKHEMLSKTQAV